MNYPDITDKAMYIIGNKLNYSYKQYYSTNECAIG